MIKLVLTDLDRTLLPDGSDVVSQEALEAIHALLDQGVRFGPVSGRPLVTVRQAFRGDERCLSDAVVANGKTVIAQGRVIREVSLEPADVGGLVHEVRKMPGWAVSLRGRQGEAEVLGCTAEELRQSRWLSYAGGAILQEPPSWPVETATMLALGDGSPEAMDAARQRVEEALPLRLVSPGPGMFDVWPLGLTKAEAVRELLCELGMSPDEVVVFGDSENDVEMLRSLPNSVAVANAAPEASRAARYHIGSCDEGAVVDALRDIAQAAPWGETPAFMRAERGRTEAPASEEPAVSERPRRAPAEVVLGLIVIAVAAALSWARVATTTLTAALLVVVLLFGVALVYLGAAELRDARRARRRSRS